MTAEVGTPVSVVVSPAEPVHADVAIRPLAPSTDSIGDGFHVRNTYAVNLDVFEGPLDLLLHLVRRHELDILDIPISFIAGKYIEYIGFARSLDIEIAGEYLLMAATLAFLKSRELLPPIAGEDEEQGEEEDGVDPREELIRRLIEYERFRDAGFALAERPLAGRDVFPRGGDLSVVAPEPGLAPVTLFRLAEAYNRILDRAKINAEHEVVIERVTVRQRMRQLSVLLSGRRSVSFERLFLQQEWSNERELRQMLVVTLMSVLEMVKLGVLGVHQAQGSDTLELERAVEVVELERVVADFRGDEEELEKLELEGELDELEAEESLAVLSIDEDLPAELSVEDEESVAGVEPVGDVRLEDGEEGSLPDEAAADAVESSSSELAAEEEPAVEEELAAEEEPATEEELAAGEEPAAEEEPAAAEASGLASDAGPEAITEVLHALDSIEPEADTSPEGTVTPESGEND